MVKYAALVSLGMGLIFTRILPLPCLSEPPAYALFALDPIELAQNNRRLDAQVRARFAFAAVRDDILQQVGRGSLSLEKACDRLYASAQQIYPKFNSHLCTRQNEHPKRKMAWNVVEGFRLDAEETPFLSAVVQRLEKELASSEFEAWAGRPW
jgi:hypothetical protein